MPDCIMGAPDLGTYNFALVRRDWKPTMKVEERNAGHICKSRCVVWPEGLPLPHMPGAFPNQRSGGAVMMMFVGDRHLRSRMTKLGWRDVTTSWLKFHEQLGAPRLSEPPVPNPKKLKAKGRRKKAPVQKPQAVNLKTVGSHA